MIIRLLARVLSGICMMVMVIPLIRDGLPTTLFTSPTDYVAFALYPCGIVLGYLIAWKHETLGSMLTIASIVSYGVLDRTVRIGEFPMGMLALLAAPAVLFIISSMVARRGSWG